MRVAAPRSTERSAGRRSLSDRGRALPGVVRVGQSQAVRSLVELTSLAGDISVAILAGTSTQEIPVRAPLPLLLLVCAAAASALRAQAASSADSAAAPFARLIADRTAVVARADTAAYRRMVDPALVFVDDNGTRSNVDQHIRDFLKSSDELAHVRWDIDSLHVSVRGDVAFVEYRELQHRPVGSRDFISPYEVSESYVRRGNRWLPFRHAEAHALALPAPRTLETPVLDDYVGRYEWWPGYVDVISRRGNDLFNQATGDKEATLNRAATPEAFYIDGDPSLLVFLRDSTGRVVAYILHEPDGQVTRARKLP